MELRNNKSRDLKRYADKLGEDCAAAVAVMRTDDSEHNRSEVRRAFEAYTNARLDWESCEYDGRY